MSCSRAVFARYRERPDRSSAAGLPRPELDADRLSPRCRIRPPPPPPPPTRPSPSPLEVSAELLLPKEEERDEEDKRKAPSLWAFREPRRLRCDSATVAAAVDFEDRLLVVDSFSLRDDDDLLVALVSPPSPRLLLRCLPAPSSLWLFVDDGDVCSPFPSVPVSRRRSVCAAFRASLSPSPARNDASPFLSSSSECTYASYRSSGLYQRLSPVGTWW